MRDCTCCPANVLTEFRIREVFIKIKGISLYIPSHSRQEEEESQ
jgi:hypothetical protein